MTRLSGIGLDLIPQLTHIHTHIVSLLYMEGPPDFFEQLAMRHDLPGIPHERRQQLIFNRREVDFRP